MKSPLFWRSPAFWVWIVHVLIYAALFQRRVLLDITAQVQTIIKVCDGWVDMPVTALFYVATWGAAGFSCHFEWLMGGALLVLSLLAVAKWAFTIRVWPTDRAGEWAFAALGLACSLPTPDWYHQGYYIAGQPSPNYWMNGTILASWPFALALFGLSYRQLAVGLTVRGVGWHLVLLLLLLISKPSYAFVHVLVFPIFLLIRYGISRLVVLHIVMIGVFLGLLVLEYWMVFEKAGSIYVKEFNKGHSSGVHLNPWAVWRLYSSNILLSVVAALVFPIMVTIAWLREIRGQLMFQYAWAGMIAALLISGLFEQNGEEHYTWAFRFQHYIAAYILFAVALHWLLKQDRHAWRARWAWWILGLHLVSGVIYLVKFWVTKSHY